MIINPIAYYRRGDANILALLNAENTVKYEIRAPNIHNASYVRKLSYKILPNKDFLALGFDFVCE